MADKSMLASLNEQLAVKQADAERIAASFKTEDGKFVISTEQHRDYVSAVNAAKELKSLIDSMADADGIRGYLDAPEGKSAAGEFYGTPAAGAEVEYKSLGDVFVKSDAYRAMRQSGEYRGGLVRAELEGKSIFTLSAGEVTHPAMGTAENLGIAERAMRKMHIRDLFPKSTTNANVLYGVRETGWTNNAAQVKERYAADGTSAATGTATDVFGLAPKSDITLTPVLYPVAEIAHTLDAHKNILADEGRLQTFLNTRMVDGVKYREDYDLLHSVGDGQSITGLYNTPGVQTYTGLAADGYSVQVRRAITKAILAEYEPSGLVVSPTMWEHIEVETDHNGQFRVAVAVAIGAQKTVWRLKVVETTAMADTDFFLGAFGMGAQLHDRQAVSVQVSNEHADNFARGVVTFRADERVALEVPRPESFVIGTWTAPTNTNSYN